MEVGRRNSEGRVMGMFVRFGDNKYLLENINAKICNIPYTRSAVRYGYQD